MGKMIDTDLRKTIFVSDSGERVVEDVRSARLEHRQSEKGLRRFVAYLIDNTGLIEEEIDIDATDAKEARLVVDVILNCDMYDPRLFVGHIEEKFGLYM